MKKSFGKLVLKAALFAAAFLIVALFSSCKTKKEKNLLERVKAKGELSIATEGVWAPWTYHDATGELTGFDIDLSKALCERLGVKARFIETPWDRIFESLQNNECDVIVNGIGITEERAGRFYFSDPYAYSRMALLVHKKNDSVKSFSDLKGRTSANSYGSTFCNLAEENGAIPIYIDTFEESINLLLQNRSETTINLDLTYYDYVNTHPGLQVKVAALSDVSFPMAIPCRREVENLPLLDELNKQLAAMRDDGTLEKISLKYFRRDITK